LSATPIQSDWTLWHTLRTRRRHTDPLNGLDAMAYRWSARLKHARVGNGYLRREADAVVALEPQWTDLTDAQLDEKVLSLREAFARRTHDRQQIRQGLAAVREVAHREIGEKPYPVQIRGALGLFHGQIVEMVTGEGKTLTASLAAVLLAWLRRPVHVVTVNDYLAQRDADSRQPIYRRCGVFAAPVLGETPDHQRSQAYRLPILYSTQKELVADWLRDQLRLGRIIDPVSARWLKDSVTTSEQPLAPEVMVPGLHVALVDEVDAVLIDEAVTPLIIAQPRGEDAQVLLYQRARDLTSGLESGRDFTIEPAKRRVRLTPSGKAAVTASIRPDEHGVWRAIRRREELVEQALVASHCYHHGQQYQIVEDRIVIVDEYSGRFMEDRQWQHGLHQAVEAKHDLPVTADRETLASMSFQRFFRLYSHLCGMTGTAADAKPEMEQTYGLPVRIIPTNRPLKRDRLDDMIFVKANDKWQAIVEEIRQMHTLGRPVLVGTRSIDASEYLSRLLNDQQLPHQVLNAVHHKAEAQIIAQAGQSGAITVATNMAGRGTDIKLGPGISDLGGLHVLMTERYTSSRIDRQLIGRAGRQGDPGSARAIISLEDDLVQKYAPGLARFITNRFRNRSTPLPRWTRLVFARAQHRAQQRAFHSRLSVMRHDENLDKSLPR